jgi:2-haloacid dehalogenase
VEIEKYYSCWIDMIGGEIHENSSLLKSLKTNYRVFGLTNWSSETFSQVHNKYPFFLNNLVIYLYLAKKG